MSVSGPRALLIVNRHARSGEEQLAAAAAALRRQGIVVLPRPTGHAEEISEAIRQAAGDADLLVLGGGDGTMNAAGGAIVESRLPLGILPLGTANDLARTLGLPLALDEACGVIAAGRRYPIDLGRANGKLFFNVASIGLSVAITRRLTGEVKRRWGVLGYPKSFVDTYRATRTFRARIRGDGDWIEVPSIQIAVGNGRFYGGGMEVADDAMIDDARLDLYSLEPVSALRLATLFPAFRRGRHRRLSPILCLSARRIEVVTGRPMPVNTDGELTTRTPVVFEVVPRAVSVFVPNDRAPGLTGVRSAA